MKPPIFKVETINLLKHLLQWEARRILLIQGLIALQLDWIVLQEGALLQNKAKIHLCKSISNVLGLAACAGST